MNFHSDKSSILFKIIIIGNQSTGKTSIVNKYLYNKFTTNYKATIISQFDFKIIKLNDQIYRLSFWDIAGQDRNPEITKLFCQNTNGVIICCEVNNITSKKDTLIWKENLLQNRIDLNKIPIILCENKSDLLFQNDEKIYELENFSNQNGFTKCFRTSAITGFGIDDMMNFILNDIIKRTNEINENILSQQDSFILKNFKKSKKNDIEKKCC